MFNVERSNQLSILLILERILGGYRENSWDGSEEQTQGQLVSQEGRAHWNTPSRCRDDVGGLVDLVKVK